MEKTKTILIVEDSPTSLRVLSAVFKNAGYRVLDAPGILGALDAARIERPDLILMDVVLEDGDGLELARVMKNDPETAQIPIFAMSSNEAEELPIRSRTAGCEGFVTKPFEVHSLAWKVVRHRGAAETVLSS